MTSPDDIWQPGDPCGSCHSTDTTYDYWDGPGIPIALCLSCGARDDDD